MDVAVDASPVQIDSLEFALVLRGHQNFAKTFDFLI
jgi:hypothetical protein